MGDKVLLKYSPALPQGIPQITQDEYDDYNAPPSANMRQQWEMWWWRRIRCAVPNPTNKVHSTFEASRHRFCCPTDFSQDRWCQSIYSNATNDVFGDNRGMWNKLLNKLSQFLLCTKWIDKGLFDCRDLHHSKVATGRREHLPDGNVSPFGNNPARQMSGWIASNRLRV